MLEFLQIIEQPKLTSFGAIAFMSLHPLATPLAKEEAAYVAAYREFNPYRSNIDTELRRQYYSLEFKPVGQSVRLLARAEDPRMFLWKGRIWCSSIVWDGQPGPTNCHQMLTDVQNGTTTELKHEMLYAGKNWIPVVGADDTLYFIRSLDPLQLVRVTDDYGCKVVIKHEGRIGWYRGGTSARFLAPNIIGGFGHHTIDGDTHAPFWYEIDLDKEDVYIEEFKFQAHDKERVIDPTSWFDDKVVCCCANHSWWRPQPITHRLYRGWPPGQRTAPLTLPLGTASAPLKRELKRIPAMRNEGEKLSLLLTHRYGDSMIMLPAAQYLAQELGYSINWIVHSCFADLFDGVSYVNPIAWDGDMRDMSDAVRCHSARKLGGRLIDVRKHNEGAECFTTDFWLNVGLLDHYHELPLTFDRRDAARETRLVDIVLGNRKDDRPIMLVNFRGHSTPIGQPDAMLQWLRDLNQAYDNKYFIVDVGSIRAARIFDLLALYELADVAINTDTATTWLSGATGTPLINYVSDGTYHRPDPRWNWIYSTTVGEARKPDHMSNVEQALFKQTSQERKLARGSLSRPLTTPLSQEKVASMVAVGGGA